MSKPTPKRANREGSYRKRLDGRWEGRLRYHDIITDLPRRLTVYGRTKEECADKLFTLRNQVSKGSGQPRERVTLGEFLERWLTEIAEPTLRTSTFTLYAGIVRNHIAPALGGKQLSRLTAPMLQAFLSAPSPRVAQIARQILRKSLRDAVAWELLDRNPAEALRAPRSPKKEISPLTADQTRALVTIAAGKQIGLLVEMAVATGLRQGELLGLQARDLDLDAGVLRVARRLDRRTRKAAEPKRAASYRKLDLGKRIVDQLRVHVAGLKPNDFLFRSSVGTPIMARNLHREWKALLERADLPTTVRWHDLRHTHATLLLGAGVHPKIVSERLGHASIAVTLDSYTSYLPTLGRAAADAIDSLLEHDRPQKPGVKMGGKPPISAPVKKKKPAKR